MRAGIGRQWAETILWPFSSKASLGFTSETWPKHCLWVLSFMAWGFVGRASRQSQNSLPFAERKSK
jgi:hypothetical protein